MSILMDPPAKFLAEIAAGKVVRVGAVLKDTATGQIVGHLKETGQAGSILSDIFTSPLKLASASNPLSFITDAVGHVVNGYQIRGVQRSVSEVKSLVEGLQLATNTAAIASVAGLGISVGGFAAINSKLNKIDAKIDSLSDDIQLIRSVLADLSISWEAMSEAQFITAAETLIAAEMAATPERRRELAKEAASKFSLLKNYYAILLKRKGFYDDIELDIECVYEIVTRYTVSCIGLLQAEFIIGDLGSYRTRLEAIMSEFRDLATFSAKEVYLSRCDKLDRLNLVVDHQSLSKMLTEFSQTSLETALRVESFKAELDYIELNRLTVDDYLSQLRNQDSDVVLLRHEKPSAWKSLSRALTGAT